MDLVSAISIIVGIILSFSGVTFALLGATQRRVLERIETTVASHDERIGYLEKRDAGREQEIKAILAGIDRVELAVQKHIERESS